MVKDLKKLEKKFLKLYKQLIDAEKKMYSCSKDDSDKIQKQYFKIYKQFSIMYDELSKYNIEFIEDFNYGRLGK